MNDITSTPQPAINGHDHGADAAPGPGSANGQSSGVQRGGVMRALSEFASALVGRYNFARDNGLTFYNTATGAYDRNLYQQLGYRPVLTVNDYRSRYERGGIAERIVEAYPQATWAGGATIIEDPDPTLETPFEESARLLFERLDLWTRITRADILAGLDTYAVVVIGAAGDPASALPGTGFDANGDPETRGTMKPADVRYLLARDSGQATVLEYDLDLSSPRYGQPLYYSVKVNVAATGQPSTGTAITDRKVHWSRVIHIADGLLDNDIYGKPRLRAVWNYLDDLDKLIGGGAEAAWKRMDPGLQVDLDPEMVLDAAEEERLSQEVDEYVHNLRRVMRTRGAKVTPLATQVAGFGPNSDAVIKLVSATTGIPYRILTGSEMGQLASTQDRLNWADRITERRRYFATPLIRQLVSRLSAIGALPEIPKSDFVGGYDIQWAGVGEMDAVTKADVVAKLTAANQAQYIANLPPVILSDEVRVILGLGPLKPEDIPPTKAELDAKNAETAAKAKADAANTMAAAADKPGPAESTPSPAGGSGPEIASAP